MKKCFQTIYIRVKKKNLEWSRFCKTKLKGEKNPKVTKKSKLTPQKKFKPLYKDTINKIRTQVWNQEKMCNTYNKGLTNVSKELLLSNKEKRQTTQKGKW